MPANTVDHAVKPRSTFEPEIPGGTWIKLCSSRNFKDCDFFQTAFDACHVSRTSGDGDRSTDTGTAAENR